MATAHTLDTSLHPGATREHTTAHLWGQSVVVRRLAGEQDVREAFLLPHHDVSKATVALALSHVVAEPLVEHVVFLLGHLPLYRAV